jgi:hypothetical protein
MNARGANAGSIEGCGSAVRLRGALPMRRVWIREVCLLLDCLGMRSSEPAVIETTMRK